jgi:hypothetical protein
MKTFAPDQASNTPLGPVILTHADRGLVLGISDPLDPVLAGKFMVPFGVSAHAAGFDAKHTYVAEEAPSPTSEFILKVTPHNSGSQHLVLGTETIPPGGVIPKIGTSGKMKSCFCRPVLHALA